MAVLEGRDELRDWTRLAAAAPKQLGVALFCRQCWLAAATGAFLPGPNAISAATAALDAAAILQPLFEQITPAALATASAKPNPIADRAELARRTVHDGCQHPHRARHEADYF